MEEKNNILLNFALNEQKHIKKYLNLESPFKDLKKMNKALTAPILRGNFYCFCSHQRQFKLNYLEFYPNLILKYTDKSKLPPIEYFHC